MKDRHVSRRQFIAGLGSACLGLYGHKVTGRDERSPVSLFLTGDVMTGRGIDQILPHPSSPEIYESYIKSALGYVRIAERVSGKVPFPVAFDYIWGDALKVIESINPDLRLINLETAVTRSDQYWPGKGINYRMHPKNFPCIKAAGIDGCILANNHTLDWDYQGLEETLDTIRQSGIKTVGAGKDKRAAEAPVVFELAGERRVIVMAFGHPSSGIPLKWQATANSPGIALREKLSVSAVASIKDPLARIRRAGDLVVVSIHWGGNWGYQVSPVQREFAHALIDEAGVDIVHGHSSHHPKAIEVYKNRPIFYGCGDFINDYEGIRGYQKYRSDLVLMYFPEMDANSGHLLRLQLVPMQISRFRLQWPSKKDRQWLLQTMDRECRRFGHSIYESSSGSFILDW